MGEWDDLTDEECAEVLGFLREKARQYGFHEMDEALAPEVEQAESQAALILYRRGFADYLRIFSEESLTATRRAFNEALGSEVEVPLRVVLRTNEEGREQVIELDVYRKCWELSAMLEQGLERPGPDKPRNPPTQGMGR